MDMASSVNSSANIGTSAPQNLFDINEVRKWISFLHAGSDGLIWVGRIGDMVGRTFSEVQDAVAWIADVEQVKPQGIYLRTTTLSGIPRDENGRRTRGGEDMSYTLPGFAADLDIAGPGHKTSHTLPPDEAEAVRIVTESGLPEPTVWVHSGGGLYPWWLLDESQDIRQESARTRAKDISEKIQKILVASGAALGWHVGGEVGDMARILRVPGTVNRKAGLERPCMIFGVPSYEHYDYEALGALVDRLYAALPEPERPAYTQTPRSLPQGSSSTLSPLDDMELRMGWDEILAGHFTYVKTKGHTDYWLRVGSTSGAEHSATTGHAQDRDRFYSFTPESLFEARVPYNKQAVYTLLNFGGLTSDHFARATKQLRSLGYGGEFTPQHTKQDLSGLVRPATALVRLDDAVDDQQPQPAALLVQADPALPVAAHDAALPKALPEVDLGSEQEAMVEIVKVISDGLIPDLYVKDGVLVHLHPKTSGNCSEVNMAVVNADLLNLLLAQHVRTFRWVSGGKDNPPVRKPCSPMMSALRAVTANTYWPGLRQLNGIIGTPTLRPDGTLIQECGYDEATGLYLAPAVKIDLVPEKITDEQVRTSRTFVFSKVFGEFCWSTPGDFANYLALLLSPMLRPYVKTTTPFGMVTATTRGSGKTNLTDAIGMVYGQSSQVLPGRSEELQKKITSILVCNSSPVIVFDNLKEGSSISSEILATLITKDTWDDRMLGASRTVEARNDRLWLASGNGLTVGGDMASRTVMVRLNPRMPKPELRQFEMGQFSDWIREPGNREDLLFHLLVLVQAWMQGGAQRDMSHTMRGFTRWAQVMGGLLGFHGLTGFLSNTDDLAELDTDEEEWTIFLAKWYELYGPVEVTAKVLHTSAQVDWVMGSSVDRWAKCFITDEDGMTPTPKRLGNMLHGMTERFFGPFAIYKRRDKITNTSMWRVEKREENGTEDH